MDLTDTPQVDEAQINLLKETIFKPLANYAIGRNEIVAGTVSPSYITPLQGLQRLEKIMDEYVGGISTYYVTNEPMLNWGLELLTMLKEDLEHLAPRICINCSAPGSSTTGYGRRSL